MGLFLVSLAVLDVVLVVLVTLVAFLGRKPAPEPPAPPQELLRTLHRARLQFAVVAAAWTLVLSGHLLILVFEVAPESAEVYLLMGQALLLVLALVFEIGLYGGPAGPADAAPATPAAGDAPR